MIRYLIKNNFKLMLRNKAILAAMLIGPILVIAMLSSAFEDMMASYESTEEFKTGYRISEDSIFSGNMEEIKRAGKEAGIVFENYPDGDPKAIMEQNDLAGFLVIEGETYTVYESADYETQGKILEYFMGQVEKQVSGQIRNSMFPKEEKEITLPVQKLEFMPAVDSKDYYGIIEVVYFIWCGVVSVAGVLNSEKRNGISQRFQISGMSEMGLYLARWVPAVLTTVCETVVTVLFTVTGAGWYSNLFVKSDAVKELVQSGMKIYIISFLFSGINAITSFYFTSIGKAKESAIISSSRGLVLLLVCIFVLPLWFGMNGIWLAAPVTEGVTFLLSMFFIYGKKENCLVLKEE